MNGALGSSLSFSAAATAVSPIIVDPPSMKRLRGGFALDPSNCTCVCEDRFEDSSEGDGGVVCLSIVLGAEKIEDFALSWADKSPIPFRFVAASFSLAAVCKCAPLVPGSAAPGLLVRCPGRGSGVSSSVLDSLSLIFMAASLIRGHEIAGR